VAVDDEVYGAALHAQVVARPGAGLDAAALREHCRRQLPALKNPRRFDLVDELPRTAAGKLARRTGR
jgi:acyl-CoA synthetase (AMP-forming)/AMP-acid ligase II